MKPNASLKSLNVKVRAIASPPLASAQPASPCRADFRASAVRRSTMMASCFAQLYHNNGRRARILATITQQSPFKAEGNHDGDVILRRQESCYDFPIIVWAS